MSLAYLTPSFGTRYRGGIEASSRLVARALANIGCGDGIALTLHDHEAPRDIGVWNKVVCCRGSKLQAGARALLLGRRFKQVYCWHLGLAPLLRFVVGGETRVFIALNGIECWRPVELRHVLALRPVFLPISAHTWEQFVDHNPTASGAPHEILHLGVPGAPVPPTPGEPGLVVMCGRLVGADRQKGFDETIAAWPRVRAAIPGARLFIIGDGPDRARLQALAGTDIGIEFLGELSDKDRDDWLRRCRVFALPSRLEGFGLVYAEAMRHGRPCLIGDADASREVARPELESVAVNAASPEAIAEGLVRLLQDTPLWDRLSASAAARFASYLSESKFRHRFQDLIHQG